MPLSGKVAQTPKGKEVNDLKPLVRTIAANSPTGQRGQWKDESDA